MSRPPWSYGTEDVLSGARQFDPRGVSRGGDLLILFPLSSDVRVMQLHQCAESALDQVDGRGRFPRDPENLTPGRARMRGQSGESHEGAIQNRGPSVAVNRAHGFESRGDRGEIIGDPVVLIDGDATHLPFPLPV